MKGRTMKTAATAAAAAIPDVINPSRRDRSQPPPPSVINSSTTPNPVVSSEDLNADSFYPRSGAIACQVVQRKKHGDSEIVEIDTAIPWHIESIAGQKFFDVLPGQLVEF